MKRVPVVSLFCLLIPVARGETARITGTILDAKTGKPMPAANVMAVREGLPPVAKNTRSGGDGAFEIEGLPAGDYSLCVQVRGSAYLDPCQREGRSGVTLKTGQTAAAIAVRLQTGAVVSIGVEDPGKLMEQRSKNGRQPEFTTGVWGPKGLYYPARLVSSPGGMAGMPGMNEYRYEVIVPRDTALTLHVSSKDLRLGDANGMALPANASREAFEHRSAEANSKSFRFTVIGLLP